MPVITSWFSTDPDLGINFNQTYAGINTVPSSVLSTGNIDQAAALVAPDTLGTQRTGTNASMWVLVKASTTITQFNLIVYDDQFNANNMTTALALSGLQMGLAQFQTFQGQTQTSADPATNPVFWAAIKGVGMQVQVSGSAATGVALSNGTTPGSVSVSATGSQLVGLQLYASAGASGAVECSVLFPRLKSIG